MLRREIKGDKTTTFDDYLDALEIAKSTGDIYVIKFTYIGLLNAFMDHMPIEEIAAFLATYDEDIAEIVQEKK